MTQDNALTDYALRRDAEAFGRIVTQYQCLILATCRRRLHDQSDVDDAVQETFLRLAQTAKEVHSNVGAWLHTCAVNVAIDINRRRTTRQRHESASVENTSKAEAPQEILAELREHLDAALLKLDPEQRELIIQRFFVGRPQVDLATEAGVSPSAISHRLDRAIETLRQHLSAMGCVIAATAGLITLLEAENASAAVPNSLTANVMKIGLSGITARPAAGWGWAFPATLIVFAAVLVIIVASWRMTVPKGRPPAIQAPAPSGIVADQNEQSRSAAPPKWQAAPQTDATAVLAGRILDNDGKPVAGATLTLDGPGGAQTKSDAQGNYVFKSIKQAGDYRIGIEAEGFIKVLPNVGNEPDLRLTPDSRARRDLVLHRGVTLLVTVTNALGEPLAHANIYADPPGPHDNFLFITPQTDATGQAKIVVPVSTARYVVAATLAGYAPAHSLVSATSTDSPVVANLVMDTGYTVKGLAICSDNKPAADCMIWPRPDWWAANSSMSGTPIDKNGKFTLKDVGSGNYALEIAMNPSLQTLATMTVTLPPQKQPMRLDVPVPSPQSQPKFAGHVRFVGGRPGYENIVVEVVSLDGEGKFYSGILDPSNARGRNNEAPFDIGIVPPGTYRVSFQSTEIEEKVLDKVQWPSKLPVIELKRVSKPHLTGSVVDAATGKPITQFAVRVGKTGYLDDGPNFGQDEHWIQVSNPAGHFDVELVGPGIYTAQVSLDGYAWMSSQPVTSKAAKGIAPIEMKATPGGSLAGIVLDPSGKPIAGSTVIPLSKAHSVSNTDHFESQAGAVTTDSSGKFFLQHLAAGTETLKIIDPNFAPLIVENLKIIEGQTTSAAPTTLLVGGSVDGTVYDGQGRPTADVTLNFQDDRYWGAPEELAMKRVATVVTNDQGHFHVDHLPHEPLWVEVSSEEYRPGVLRRVVLPMDGKTAHLDFGGTTPLTGRILLAGKPLANKRVELTVQSQNFGPVMDLGQTDADGRFTFYGPPPGRCTLFCENPVRGWDWNAIATVQVGAKPVDLGVIVDDVGDVQIKLVADDPKDMTSVQNVSVRPAMPKGLDYLSASTTQDGADDVWRAKNIPAGHLRAIVEMKGDPNISFMAPFDRPTAVPQTTVVVHLQRRSAPLKITLKQPATGDRTSFVSLGNEEKTVQVGIGFPLPTTSVNLPPGSYRLVDWSTGEVQDSFAPIVLKDSQTTETEIDLSSQNKTDRSRVIVNIWTADGVLVAGPKLHLLDAAGTQLDPIEDYDLGQRFALRGGHYRAVMDRAGADPLIREIDVPNSDSAHGHETSINLNE